VIAKIKSYRVGYSGFSARIGIGAKGLYITPILRG